MSGPIKYEGGGGSGDINADKNKDKDRERRGDELKLDVDDGFRQRRLVGGSMSGPIKFGQVVPESFQELQDGSNYQKSLKFSGSEVNNELSKSTSKNRFLAEDIPDTYLKRERNKGKSSSKNHSDDGNKMSQQQSSSSVLNRVSNAVKMKNKNEQNNKKDDSKVATLTQPKSALKASAKSLDLALTHKEMESDSGSHAPVTPPRLSVPAVSAIGPPSFSPDKLNILDKQLSAMNLQKS